MAGASGESQKADDDWNGDSEPKSLQDMKKAHIEKVIDLAEGDIEKAAELLMISVPDLRRWMTKLGIQ